MRRKKRRKEAYLRRTPRCFSQLARVPITESLLSVQLRLPRFEGKRERGSGRGKGKGENVKPFSNVPLPLLGRVTEKALVLRVRVLLVTGSFSLPCLPFLMLVVASFRLGLCKILRTV